MRARVFEVDASRVMLVGNEPLAVHKGDIVVVTVVESWERAGEEVARAKVRVGAEDVREG